MTEILSHIGNQDLMKRQKTAFLCSSKTTSRDILKCFRLGYQRTERFLHHQWLPNQARKRCVAALSETPHPVIIVLARKMYKVLPIEIQSAIDRGEALILSITKQPRNSKESAIRRNKYIIDIADTVVIGALDASSSLANISR